MRLLLPSLLDAGWNGEMQRKKDGTPSVATPESYTSQSSSVEWLPSHLLLLLLPLHPHLQLSTPLPSRFTLAQ